MKRFLDIKVCIIAFMLAFSGGYFGYSAVKKNDKTKHTPNIPLQSASLTEFLTESASLPEKTTVKFSLKEYNNVLGVFKINSDGKKELYEVYDVAVNTLPAEDRKKIHYGIESSSLSEILQIIEDYIA